MGDKMISVIIPVYNGEKYIPALIENLKAQNASKSSLELVFVDDGSKDGSLELLNFYKECDEFTVSVYSQQNAGVSAARNLGIKHAKGDYITFLDVDDFVTNDYYDLFANAVSKENFDILVFSSIRVRGAEKPELSGDYTEPQTISNNDMLCKMLGNPTKYGACNLLYKRDFVSNNALSFSVGFKYYEDYDFIYRAFALANGILITEKPIYFYMMREGSAMQRFTKDRLDCISLMENLKQWFKDAAPEFYPIFSKWGASRIYWSIFWQAALAFNYKDFKKFANILNAKEKLSQLYDYPDKRVKLSSRLYGFGEMFYYLGVRLIGASHSKVEKADISNFFD